MTEQGGTIGNGIEGRRTQLLQPSDVMQQLLADNGHAPLPGQEDAPPPEPVLHRIWTEHELREIDPQLHQFTDMIGNSKVCTETLCMRTMDHTSIVVLIERRI